LDNQCDVNTTAANGMTCFFAAAHNNKVACDSVARRLLKTGKNAKNTPEKLYGTVESKS